MAEPSLLSSLRIQTAIPLPLSKADLLLNTVSSGAFLGDDERTQTDQPLSQRPVTKRSVSMGCCVLVCTGHCWVPAPSTSRLHYPPTPTTPTPATPPGKVNQCECLSFENHIVSENSKT